MCKNRTGIDFLRNRRCKKSTVYLVLQCVLLVETILLLGLELKTKNDEYENKEEHYIRNKKELLAEIQVWSKRNDKLVNDNNNNIKKNQQLNEEKDLLSKHLRQMDGWKCYQSGLYYISSDMKNWTDSKEDCVKRGAHLIIINNREEQEFLKKYAGIWIGLTDSDVENTWNWVDGSTLTSSFWAPGEPGNLGKNEGCAMLNPSGWSSNRCNDVFKWACERKAS